MAWHSFSEEFAPYPKHFSAQWLCNSVSFVSEALALGRRLFHRFCYGSDPAMDGASDAEYEEAFATLLEDLVSIMRRRTLASRGL